MANGYVNRVLTRQFLGPNALSDALSNAADATPVNNPGSKIFVQDIAGNMASFCYVGTASLTAIAIGVPMYWNSTNRTTATDTVASAVTHVASSNGAIHSAAGVAINNNLNTTTPYGWIFIGGYLSSLQIPSSASVGDKLVLSNAAATAPTNDVWVRLAFNTAAAVPEAISSLYCVITAAAQTPTAGGFVMGTVGLP